MVNIRGLAKIMKQKDPSTSVKDNEKAVRLLIGAIEDTLLVQGQDVKLGKLLKLELSKVSSYNGYDGINKCNVYIPEHSRIKLKKLSKLKYIDFLLKNTN